MFGWLKKDKWYGWNEKQFPKQLKSYEALRRHKWETGDSIIWHTAEKAVQIDWFTPTSNHLRRFHIGADYTEELRLSKWLENQRRYNALGTELDELKAKMNRFGLHVAVAKPLYNDHPTELYKRYQVVIESDSMKYSFDNIRDAKDWMYRYSEEHQEDKAKPVIPLFIQDKLIKYMRLSKRATYTVTDEGVIEFENWGTGMASMASFSLNDIKGLDDLDTWLIEKIKIEQGRIDKEKRDKLKRENDKAIKELQKDCLHTIIKADEIVWGDSAYEHWMNTGVVPVEQSEYSVVGSGRNSGKTIQYLEDVKEHLKADGDNVRIETYFHIGSTVTEVWVKETRCVDGEIMKEFNIAKHFVDDLNETMKYALKLSGQFKEDDSKQEELFSLKDRKWDISDVNELNEFLKRNGDYVRIESNRQPYLNRKWRLDVTELVISRNRDSHEDELVRRVVKSFDESEIRHAIHFALCVHSKYKHKED